MGIEQIQRPKQDVTVRFLVSIGVKASDSPAREFVVVFCKPCSKMFLSHITLKRHSDAPAAHSRPFTVVLGTKYVRCVGGKTMVKMTMMRTKHGRSKWRLELDTGALELRKLYSL